MYFSKHVSKLFSTIMLTTTFRGCNQSSVGAIRSVDWQGEEEGQRAIPRVPQVSSVPRLQATQVMTLFYIFLAWIVQFSFKINFQVILRMLFQFDKPNWNIK